MYSFLYLKSKGKIQWWSKFVCYRWDNHERLLLCMKQLCLPSRISGPTMLDIWAQSLYVCEREIPVQSVPVSFAHVVSLKYFILFWSLTFYKPQFDFFYLFWNSLHNYIQENIKNFYLIKKTSIENLNCFSKILHIFLFLIFCIKFLIYLHLLFQFIYCT